MIHYASQSGLLSVVQNLIEKDKIDIDIRGDDERTPLHCACWLGKLPIVEYLISKDANIEAKDNLGNTPLHYASEHIHTDIVKYLVSKGANKNSKNKNGKTPYDLTWKSEIKTILKQK